MATSGPRSSARERLLDRAEALISEHGVQELTLEGVAAAAGVTKGGLIYHFKTKDDLLGALVERMMTQVGERSRARAAERGDTPRALLLALIDDTFDMPRKEKAVYSNLLAAISHYPHLLGPARGLFAGIYGQLAKLGPHAGHALALASALDGMVFLELLDFHHFTKPQRDAVRAALQELAKSLP